MNLIDFLHQKMPDSLRELGQLTESCRGRSRKEDLVWCIQQAMTDPVQLGRLWRRLDDLSQKAVAAAYYNAGAFDVGAFVAQYGKLPDRPRNRSLWQQPVIPLDLFLYGGQVALGNPLQSSHLPVDLMPLLEELVPPQDKFQVQGLDDAPRSVRTAGGNILELVRAETEEAGLHDLTAYLHLVAQGELKAGASYRGGNTTSASLRKIADHLLKGDFFPLPEEYRPNQTIRPFGLDIFARNSRLVAYNYRENQLQLTEAGLAFYQTQDPQILLEAFITWTEEGHFDELSRITAIKGQKTKYTHLSAAHTRREAVIEALSWCPPYVWISIEDFYRAIRIWHFDFKIELTTQSNLYIGQKEYGILTNETYWHVLKGSYINAVLWEYLASVGALDLLYVQPEVADFKLNAQNLYYDQAYISLYDGLKYFRINPLGAYLLGHVGDYVPSRPREQAILSLSAAGEVKITRPEAFTPVDQSQLSLMAVPDGKNRYRLDTEQILNAVEAGNTWQHLLDYLSSRHQGPLPPEIQERFQTLEQNSQLFKLGGAAQFIRVKSAALADMVMADAVLQKFVQRLDPKTLVIPASREKAFRNRLKALEYLLL